jgi:ABC-type multidrug transport system ATPase subunit
LSAPRLVLLDEPYTGLDQRGRKWLAEWLLGVKSSGGTLVVTTHSFGDALDIADRVALLAGGRLALDRPSAELTRDGLSRLYETLTAGGAGPA